MFMLMLISTPTIAATSTKVITVVTPSRRFHNALMRMSANDSSVVIATGMPGMNRVPSSERT